jgi:lipopolysaccharide transport system permease protein
LTVEYRDFRFVVPFAIQFGTYISPVGFSSTIVPESWRFLYDLNPVVGIIDGFRWSILGEASPLEPRSILLSIAVTALMLYTGLRYFRGTERGFADVI